MSSTKGRFEYLEARRISKILFLILPSIIAILSFGALLAENKNKIVVGAVEEVKLLPWGVKLPARIDTGSGMTSLDARDLTVKNKVAQFRLPEKYGDILIRLPVIQRRNIRTSDSRDRRPVVEIELRVGSKRIRVQANLNDRSHLTYPLNLGRDVLTQGFIVDCAQENLLSSKPSGGGSK
jgi:hypothetical protein